jgi:hypothetical protein
MGSAKAELIVDLPMPGGKRQSLYSAHVLIISAKRLDKRIPAKGMKASLGRMFSANRSSFS